MGANFFDLICMFLFSVPVLTIGVLLGVYVSRRAVWKRGKRLGRTSLGYYPSAFALGMALQIFQAYYRPTTDYVVAVKLVEDAEDDDEGDPETPTRHMNRQLRRIRRGEPIDTLVFRLRT